VDHIVDIECLHCERYCSTWGHYLFYFWSKNIVGSGFATRPNDIGFDFQPDSLILDLALQSDPRILDQTLQPDPKALDLARQWDPQILHLA